MGDKTLFILILLYRSVADGTGTNHTGFCSMRLRVFSLNIICGKRKRAHTRYFRSGFFYKEVSRWDFKIKLFVLDKWLVMCSV